MTIPSVEQLDLAGVLDVLEKGEGVLVDTLPPEHFEARHIPGARNACVYEVVFLETLAGLVPDRGTRVVLYGAGQGSGDAMAAADKLVRAGYVAVAVYPGGLKEWREDGRALEGDDCEVVEPPHPQLALEPRTYGLVSEDSVVRWTGRNDNGAHHGLLPVSGGSLDAAGEPSATFTLDLAGLRNLDLAGDELQPVLEDHLRSDDFFFTTLFPEANFDTTVIRLVEEGQATRPNAMMQGVLSLRGMENEIAFPAHIRNLAGGRIAVIGNLDFDRTQWGIIYGSSRFFHHLGYHTVYDFISVDFRLVLQ